jgi:exoribonuclease-2
MERHTDLLNHLAREAMRERGLEPDYPRDALAQLDAIQGPADLSKELVDLRHLLWASIDNDNSRDLDQLTYAQKEADGSETLWVAVADVETLVTKNSPIDVHAQVNTTSVYTPSIIFPMLPERLSTNLTSLNELENRVAVVIKMVINQDGKISDSAIYRAVVCNKAKLAYRLVGAWLEGVGSIPQKIATTAGLEEVIRLQNDIAKRMRKSRYTKGALTLETVEEKAVFKNEYLVGMEHEKKNLAHQLIEECMIGANWVVAKTLASANIASFRRVVRIPKRWDRIVEIAKELGETLPLDPDSKALDAFLVKMQNEDPKAFPDLSLTIIKLLGSGEYVVEYPGDDAIGHFGLALKDYTHSTAPNRRYPDIITQRQLKALLKETPTPYQAGELEILATHCTACEDAVQKIERQLNKSAVALLLSNQIGNTFQGIVTGASERGTWVRIFTPSIEGKVIRGMKHLDVGMRIRVKLVSVDPIKGHIDFAKM